MFQYIHTNHEHIGDTHMWESVDGGMFNPTPTSTIDRVLDMSSTPYMYESFTDVISQFKYLYWVYIQGNGNYQHSLKLYKPDEPANEQRKVFCFSTSVINKLNCLDDKKLYCNNRLIKLLWKDSPSFFYTYSYISLNYSTVHKVSRQIFKFNTSTSSLHTVWVYNVKPTRKCV